MNRRIVFAALVGVLALCACARTPDETRIRDAIASMRRAVEAHQPRDFMAWVSADFAGQDGTVDREGLAKTLRIEVLRNDKVGVALGPIDVDLQGDRATVHVVVTLTGGAGGLPPERGAVYAITSGWKLDGRDWRCYNARWSNDAR